MKKLQRDDKITMHYDNGNRWSVKNVRGELLVDSNADYMIYMSNVNFKNGNTIEGRYLGEIDNDSPLLKVQDSKVVTINGTDFLADGEKVRTAKMIVVNNKTNVIIVIASR